jgi:hypothetical protein
LCVTSLWELVEETLSVGVGWRVHGKSFLLRLPGNQAEVVVSMCKWPGFPREACADHMQWDAQCFLEMHQGPREG